MKVVNRIKANEDFALAIKNGRSLKNQSFSVHCLKNEYNRIRVGISVSKKLGDAVIRNRIKRQIRAMCDSIFDYTSMSLDVVLIAKRGFLDKDFRQNKEMLQDLISEALTGVTR